MTITLRRSAERAHVSQGGGHTWTTFAPKGPDDAPQGGFGLLESLVEHDLAPGMGFQVHAHGDHEMVTYVEKGDLIHADSDDPTCRMRAGDFCHTSGRAGMIHKGLNKSGTERAHVFQSGLASVRHPFDTCGEQKHFPLAERRGVLCRVASSGGQEGSLRIHQDAGMDSSLLYRGTHLIHEFIPGRCGWLHVVSGRILFGEHRLGKGDAVAIADELAVSFTADEPSEILLFDLP